MRRAIWCLQEAKGLKGMKALGLSLLRPEGDSDLAIAIPTRLQPQLGHSHLTNRWWMACQLGSLVVANVHWPVARQAALPELREAQTTMEHQLGSWHHGSSRQWVAWWAGISTSPCGHQSMAGGGHWCLPRNWLTAGGCLIGYSKTLLTLFLRHWTWSQSTLWALGHPRRHQPHGFGLAGLVDQRRPTPNWITGWFQRFGIMPGPYCGSRDGGSPTICP